MQRTEPAVMAAPATEGRGGPSRVSKGALLALALVAIGGAVVAPGCGGGEEGDEDPAATTTTHTGTDQDGAAGAAIDPSKGNRMHGAEIFANNCATCHGTTGAGGATGPSLQQPDLASQPDMVVRQIVEGGGGMPAFGDQVSDNDIADVAAYVINDVAEQGG